MICSNPKYSAFLLNLSIGILRFLTALDAADVIRLEKKYVHTDSITIAGHSSGGAFCHILHIVHSKLFVGAGLFSGAYYSGTLQDSTPPVSKSLSDLRRNEKAGLIDQLKNLKNQRIFIYAGTEDLRDLVFHVSNLVEIYAPYLARPSNLFTKIQYANHLPPPSGECTSQEEPKGTYNGGCHYDGILASLEFILKRKLKKPNGRTKLQKLMKFDQTEFIDDFDRESSLAKYGLLYITYKCSKRRECLLHLYFRGCFIGSPDPPSDEVYIQQLGYLEIAEANNIILVIPRIKATKFNPLRCWDVGEYTGPNYATNKGLQVVAVRRILKRISGL